MAWSTPRTWVSEEVITAEIMNVHVRDQFTFIGTHGHSSNSGDGGDDLGGIDEIIFADATADPAAIGEMQRNGSALKYHDGTGVLFLGRDAPAGTPSLRTLGAGGTQAADGTHTHTLQGTLDELTGTIIDGGGISAGNPSFSQATAAAGAGTVLATQVINTTGSAIVFWSASWKASSSGSNSGDMRFNVRLASADVQTVDATANGWNAQQAVSPSGTVLAAGAHTFELEYRNKSGVATRVINYQHLTLDVFAGVGTFI